MKRINQVFVIALALTIQSLALPQLAEAKGPPVRIYSSAPADGVQGETWTITLSGDNFENANPEVRYIHNLTGVVAPNSKMGVSNPVFVSSEQIEYELTIGDDADIGEYDIEIYYATSGRKGKGTTLFSVTARDETPQPSECNLEFDATFDDVFDAQNDQWMDAARSDNIYDENGTLVTDMGPYYAFGGTGMRLDTNGSQSLERKNDTRFLTIDFNVSGTCDTSNPHNPGGAAGFCKELKGADMRFEHKVQELVPNGLCLLDSEDPDNDSMRVTVGILFKQTAGDKLLGEQPRKGTGAVRLNYGCQAQFLLQGYQRIGPEESKDYRAVVTRIDQHTWRIEGEKACLHTQYGDILKASDGSVSYLTMPFGLTLIDANAPPNP